ncbi:protein daughter of sevenless isoform X2 [Condylostylus longicornis]|uniref:protein daughter of sevenless isoform X2 n=1 Tax=Condylostylus longicornis TaxID=2530218 RepID=UPI00244DF418|nr:protein daughter of sevenless isoform X2 [Condylostylus longicornis]
MQTKMQVNREVLQEGWLIKSPPTKRILRARWRRRWFTLKQGEIPGQFCLEYYTDRNCRKLKGVIDLDQCEQVDSGLRLEHRKQKFQYMFDIKTPRRTYYLAADTENDMRDWVNCICQVCNLHESSNDRQYYNLLLSPNDQSKKESHETIINNSKERASNVIAEIQIENPTTASNSENLHRTSTDNTIAEAISDLNISEDVQCTNEMPYVNTEFINREASSCDKSISLDQNNRPQALKEKAIRSGSFRQNTRDESKILINDNNSNFIPNHTRSKSEQISSITLKSHGGAVKKKIPDNLVLNNTAEDSSGNVEPSPALSTSSGPYIPLSQCFSGSPKYCNNPTTPLNNLDPKFYETPRNSHINFGLNLSNDQSYSPKITNFTLQDKAKSGHSSPTDSESVFTDEDESTYRPSRNNSDRKARPSDSSVENDLIVFSYDQRFSKFSYENSETDKIKTNDKKVNDSPQEVNHFNLKQKLKSRLELQPKQIDDRNSKDFPQFSDTENTSPAALAKNTSMWVADQRTQQYCNMNNSIAASTPNLYSDNQNKTLNFGNIQSGTLPRSNPFMNMERNEENIFRYDFIERGKSQLLNEGDILPPVNRELKPKYNFDNTGSNSMQSKSTNTLNKITSDLFPIRPPSIDRTLKPAFKSAESPNRRSHIPTASLTIPSEFSSLNNAGEIQTQTLPRMNQPSSLQHNNNMNNNNNSFINNNQGNAIYNNNNLFLQNITSPVSGSVPAGNSFSNNLQIPANQIQKLEYCDLEITNGPCTNRSSIISTISQQSDTKTPPKSNTVYRSIDFEKTRVLNQIREDPQGRTRRKD